MAFVHSYSPSVSWLLFTVMGVELAWHLQRSRIFNKFRSRKKIQMLFSVQDFETKSIHNDITVNEQPTPVQLQVNNTTGSDIIQKYIYNLLQACESLKELNQIHAHLIIKGFDKIAFVKTKLLTIYAKYRSVADARKVFDKMCKPNVFTWNLMICGHARNGFHEKALELYFQMQAAGIWPNKFTFPAVLKACAAVSALQEGKQIHAHSIRAGFLFDVYVGNSLVTMYAKCGSLEDACHVFEKMLERDVVSWNAMIVGYAQNGYGDEALELFDRMHSENVMPDSVTVASALQASAQSGDMQKGKWIHNYALHFGFQSDVSVVNALLAMYAKCGRLEFTRQLFDIMSQRNVVSWNTIIAGYAQNGDAGEALTLFNQMQLSDMKADSVTMVSVSTACGQLASLHQGNRIHGYVLKCGLESDVAVGTSFVDMYGKCGNVDMAYALFDKMPRRNVVSWSAMIAAYAQNRYADMAVTLFNQMQLNNLEPNSVTMVSCVLACAHLASLQQGKCIHGYIIKSGFESEVVVGTALIDMYAKCESIDTAEQLFKRMVGKNLVSWNAMLAGYAEHSDEDKAFALFNQMLLESIKPNSSTIVSALSACSHPGSLQQGKWIHDYMIRSNFETDIFVENSLVAMYSRCGDVEAARQLFETIPTTNVVTWNTMIAGYVQSGDAREAFALLNQMQPDELPDSVTLVSVLPACAHLAALQQGKSIHCYLLRNGFELDIVVGTALIDMYAKCGKVHIAQQIFDSMSARNVASWNTIIAGYGMHGRGKDALELFERMQTVGTQPDHITFVCLLTACSHAGMVEEGWDCFNSMTQDYSIPPRAEHYACMVDLLGRAGHIDEALDFVKKMPIEPGASVLGALLGACRIHCNIEIGEKVADLLLQLEPQYAGYYVLLSNIYATAGRWNDVVKVRKMMKYRGIKKIPGYSLIEVNNRVHTFIVEDRLHPQSEKIYATLETLSGKMEEAQYVLNTNFVLHNVDEKVKESTLYSQ